MDEFALKTVYNTFVIMFSALFAYLSIDAETMMLFSVLLMIDYITGLQKAFILGHSITSNRMKYGVISKLLLLLIPIVLAIGAKLIDADFHYVLNVGMFILVFSEIYSIIGNIYSARTKEELPELDAVKILGKYIRDIILRQVGSK